MQSCNFSVSNKVNFNLKFYTIFLYSSRLHHFNIQIQLNLVMLHKQKFKRKLFER